MSELTFKTFGELDISEALSDASHVVIEENGDVKRFPANSIGKVKTINGAEPDENGNVAVEIPEGFSGSWNDLNDKPFGEETKVFTWYGENTTDLETVTDPQSGLVYYRIPEFDWTFDELLGAKVFTNFVAGNAYDTVITEANVINNGNAIIERYGGIDSNGEIALIYTKYDYVYVNGPLFSKAGLWLCLFNGTPYSCVQKIEKEIVKVLDENYVPDTIARASDIVSSWNDLEDKPFGEIPGAVLLDKTFELVDAEWSRAPIEASPILADKKYIVKIGSDDYGEVSYEVEAKNSTDEYYHNYFDPIGAPDGLSMIEIEYNSTLYCWRVRNVSGYGGIFKITIIDMPTHKVIDPVYLSKGTYVSDAEGENVTAAKFNELLAALRSAGYLATE